MELIVQSYLVFVAVWGVCNHAFHLHCILKWVTSQTPQAHCPMCRREWEFTGWHHSFGTGFSFSFSFSLSQKLTGPKFKGPMVLKYPLKRVMWALYAHFPSELSMDIDAWSTFKPNLNSRFVFVQIETVKTKLKLWSNYRNEWWNLPAIICSLESVKMLSCDVLRRVHAFGTHFKNHYYAETSAGEKVSLDATKKKFYDFSIMPFSIFVCAFYVSHSLFAHAMEFSKSVASFRWWCAVAIYEVLLMDVFNILEGEVWVKCVISRLDVWSQVVFLWAIFCIYFFFFFFFSFFKIYIFIYYVLVHIYKFGIIFLIWTR